VVSKIVFVESGFGDGAMQMQLDEALARAFLLPTLRDLIGANAVLIRFYGWSPPAISLGFNQAPTAFDLDKLAADGIDLVRRPTGGRAVFHIDELTYAAILCLGKSPAEHYADINRALSVGLETLGVETAFQKQQPNFRERYARVASVPCFTASARYELEINGKKLVGSAQRRFGTVLLQHGSIMLTPKHRNLTRYLSTTDAALLAGIRQDLDAKTISVSEVLGRTPSYNELCSALKTGFETAWQLPSVTLSPTDAAALTKKTSSLHFEH